jgi:very-short-patch-repair endonuclease
MIRAQVPRSGQYLGMPKPQTPPPQFESEPFTVSDARAAGLTAARLRASDLRAPHRGVRVRGPLADPLLDRLAAYQVRMRPEECFSHVTAAQWYGIPMPRQLETATSVDVSVAAPAFPPQARGVVGHRLSAPILPRVYRGFRCVSPARVWTQLASILSHEDLVVAGDFLVRRKRPLCTLAELRRAIELMGGSRGAKAARLAIRDVRAGTDSPMESRTRLVLVSAGLPEPVIGFTIRDRHGDYLATPDLAYVKERIAIEYEGDIHRSDPRVFADDIERRELLEDVDWLVIRVISSHLGVRRQFLIDRVRRALAGRADRAASTRFLGNGFWCGVVGVE